MTSSDVVILLIGLHGAGKSTFARKATGANVAVAPRGGVYPHTKKCEIHMTTHKGEVFTIIDTPGLADRDTTEQNFEVLQQIAEQLHNIGHERVSGVIYFHSIENTRLQGTDMANLRILKAICGEAFFPRVAFITTRWNCIKQDHLNQAEMRNQHIEEERKKLLPTGPEIFKFHIDDNSHQQVLDYFLDQLTPPPPQLRFTQELVRHHWERKMRKAVRKTEAGKEVAAHSRKDPVSQLLSWLIGT